MFPSRIFITLPAFLSFHWLEIASIIQTIIIKRPSDRQNANECDTLRLDRVNRRTRKTNSWSTYVCVCLGWRIAHDQPIINCSLTYAPRFTRFTKYKSLASQFEFHRKMPIHCAATTCIDGCAGPSWPIRKRYHWDDYKNRIIARMGIESRAVTYMVAEGRIEWQANAARMGEKLAVWERGWQSKCLDWLHTMCPRHRSLGSIRVCAQISIGLWSDLASPCHHARHLVIYTENKIHSLWTVAPNSINDQNVHNVIRKSHISHSLVIMHHVYFGR